MSKTTVKIEEQRSLLLSLAVLYDVELRALRVRQAWETAGAAEVYERARRVALARTISLYREGLEDEATTAQALANVSIQATVLDRAQTEYLIAWYELEAAALPAESAITGPTTRPAAGGFRWTDWIKEYTR